MRRLWDEPKTKPTEPEPSRLTKFRHPPREPSGEVVPLRVAKSRAADVDECRERTRATLRQIAMSLKFRDVVLRNGLADRCAACRRCKDMAD